MIIKKKPLVAILLCPPILLHLLIIILNVCLPKPLIMLLEFHKASISYQESELGWSYLAHYIHVVSLQKELPLPKPSALHVLRISCNYIFAGLIVMTASQFFEFYFLFPNINGVFQLPQTVFSQTDRPLKIKRM